ncbi:MAG: DEAD/DEAH box helicase [Theionarchaea archaeon]|nr:DEAD/DEAH box helicase [Theionarchaea archaeon]MBU7038882.1 DEAD/DEAH box helicase [Theionarchaea archaeon]
MLIIRKTTRKTPELEIYSIKNGRRIYYLTLREEKGRIRPYRFRSGDELYQPKRAVQMLKSEPVFLSRDDETLTIKNELEELFSYLQTKYEWIDLCRHCFIEGRVTQNPEYIYHGENICRSCALHEVKKELTFRKVSIPVEPILDRLKNVDQIISLLDPRYTKAKDTLYDVIEGHMPENPLSVEELDLPERFKAIIKKEVTHLLPIQQKAVESGLLKDRDLLVVSATASGKTLIAELAGLKKVCEGKKFLFLVPLVALANQKYEDFKKRYSSLCRVSIRVGTSRIRTTDDLLVMDSDVSADILVGTYEGLDFLIRANVDLGDVGCIAIDEVHMVSDPERGPRLDGMISRLRALYPEAQFLGLSATVGNPEEISRDLKCTLVLYAERPVPLERHIVLTPDKNDTIKELIEKEWKSVSRYGYHGQSILFTNSRRNCETLAGFLRSKGIRAQAYHAGLPYVKRKSTELSFWNQKLQAVCCTAALSAGVDFPSSCVIFDSYKMGIEELRKQEFEQMTGRAGRPLYHEKGTVYLLVEPFSEEDTVLHHLLEGEMEDVDMVYTKEQELENVLAARACGLPLEAVNGYALWELDSLLVGDLENCGMVAQGEITGYGRAASVSFLNVEQAEFIRRNLRKDVLDIVVPLESFANVYLTQRLKSQLDLEVDTLFSGACLEVLARSDAGLTILKAFFVCDCRENPYCEHSKWNISRYICELRVKGLSPSGISRRFRQDYGLLLYPGDVFSYLDAVVHKLEAVERVADVFGEERTVKKARALKSQIER